MYITVSPAYGRDYKSIAEVKKAWAEGKDFVIETVMHPDCGRYINRSDAEGLSINVRYAKLTKVVRVE